MKLKLKETAQGDHHETKMDEEIGQDGRSRRKRPKLSERLFAKRVKGPAAGNGNK